jgi:PTH2 family peptidyl-tRNA hydrolase
VTALAGGAPLPGSRRVPVQKAGRTAARTVSCVETKLTLVVRADLGMGRGKIAAQAAHAAVAAALSSAGSRDFRNWLRDGQPKVVLRAGSEGELLELAVQARAAGLPVQVIRDAGRTQVAEGTPTCCAIGPADAGRIDAITGELSLL